MSAPPSGDMGQRLGYQAYLSKYVLYFLRCPTKGRPKDCIHPCPRYVHSGVCAPCTQFVELECYCEATGIVKPCQEWCDMDDSQKELIKCCRVRCAKVMDCGHQCPQICHPGRCAEPKQCVENVVRYCGCERIERVFPCRGCGANDQEVQCDAICAKLLKSYRQAIAELKNNPFKQQQQQQQQQQQEEEEEENEKDKENDKGDAKENAYASVNNNADSLCGEEFAVEAEEVIHSDKSTPPEVRNESESESGFNDDSKNSEDDRADGDSGAEAAAKPSDVEEEVEVEAEVEVEVEVEAEAEAERGAHALRSAALPASLVAVAADSDELYASMDSEDLSQSKKCRSRVSRSSSRVSSYSEEDVPRQLDQDKIVKIMRSSTRRKKLIKCDQSDVINEMQSSS